MNTCKTCCYWVDSNCIVPDLKRGSSNPETLISIEVDVLDDSGLDVRMKTGPEFGCVLHENIK